MRVFRSGGIAFVAILVFFSLNSSFAQQIETMRAEFVRTVTTAKSSEVISGILFSRAGSRVILKVKEPVNQWIVIEPDSMLVYYPNEKKAFRFPGKQPSYAGFASMLSGAQQADFGLAEMGFTITGSETKAGSLVTKWKPPKSLQKTVKTATVESREGKPYRLELADPGKGYQNSVTYSAYVSFGSRAIPSRIESVTKSRTAATTETFVYSAHEFNIALPNDVIDFRVPFDVKIEDVKL